MKILRRITDNRPYFRIARRIPLGHDECLFVLTISKHVGNRMSDWFLLGTSWFALTIPGLMRVCPYVSRSHSSRCRKLWRIGTFRWLRISPYVDRPRDIWLSISLPFCICKRWIIPHKFVFHFKFLDFRVFTCNYIYFSSLTLSVFAHRFSLGGRLFFLKGIPAVILRYFSMLAFHEPFYLLCGHSDFFAISLWISTFSFSWSISFPYFYMCL